MTTQKFNDLLENIHDDKYFKILHDEYYPYIIKYGLAIYRNRDIAEDISQDIFNYLLTHKITTEIRKPYVWLYTIVKNYFKKYKTDTVPLENLLDVSSGVGDYIKVEVRLAIEKLDPDEQEIILLKWYGGFSLKDIAKIKNRSFGAVWKQHERILKKLKTFLSS